MIKNCKKILRISAKLLPVDVEIIKIYMQGAVEGFCNCNPKDNLSVRILFGGNNRNWNETPMQKIYDYYIKIGKPEKDAAKSASIDAGKLLTSVLADNSREFELVGKDSGNIYRLVL